MNTEVDLTIPASRGRYPFSRRTGSCGKAYRRRFSRRIVCLLGSVTALCSALGLSPVYFPLASHAEPALPSAIDCPVLGSDFDCEMQQRIARANVLIAHSAPAVGYVLRDRATQGIYRNSHANDQIFAASTVKLAMTVDLLTRDRAGIISLSAQDRSHIQAMLHSSDDIAADNLWMKYWGPDHAAFLHNFPLYGMTDIHSQGGYDGVDIYWGAFACTPNDLDRLMQYILDVMNPVDTAYIVGQMQTVDVDQQWGVWGAGPSMAPGNKDGWSGIGGWVLHSVGFAGLGQRYTLTIMNPSSTSMEEGSHIDTRIAQILLAGRE